MNDPDGLVIRAAAHPDTTVSRVGFDLDHRYLERCWTPLLGPAAVALLRHLSTLCREQEAVRTSIPDLADELGVKPASMRRTLRRIEQFGFVSPPHSNGVRDLYATIPPLSDRQVTEMPAVVRAAHHRLLGDHLDHLAAAQPAHTVAQRLDRLQRQPAAPALQR